MFPRDTLVTFKQLVLILNMNHFPTNKINGQEKATENTESKGLNKAKN